MSAIFMTSASLQTMKTCSWNNDTCYRLDIWTKF